MKKLIKFAIAFLLTAQIPAYAADFLSLPYTFQARQLISASKIMSNYNSLRNGIVDGTKKINVAQMYINNSLVVDNDLDITAKDISLTGNLRVTGNINVDDGLVGSETTNKKIDVYKDYIAASKTFTQLIADINADSGNYYSLLIAEKDVPITASTTIPVNVISIDFERRGRITGAYTITMNNTVINVQDGVDAFGSGVIIKGQRRFKDGVLHISSSGSDNNIGSIAEPVKTLTAAIGIISDGDTLYIDDAELIVTADIDMSSLSEITVKGTLIFQTYDSVTTNWTVDATYTNTYTATVSHTWGGTGSKLYTNRGLPNLLQGNRRLQEIRVETGTNDFQQATVAAAKTYVNANAGTFYVDGKNGSEYDSGWEAGDQVYYVHPFGSTDASTETFYLSQRRAPLLGVNNHFDKVVVFGGFHRDGILARDCYITDLDIYNPAGHGGLFGGSKIVDAFISGGNKSAGTGYAIHGYTEAANYAYQLRVGNLTVKNFVGAGLAAIGSHSDNIGIDDSLGVILVDKMMLDTVQQIYAVTDVTDGLYINDIKAKGIAAFGSSSEDVYINDGDINMIYLSDNANSAMISLPDAGATLNIRSVDMVGTTQLLRDVDGAGGLNVYDSILICGFDQTNYRWARLEGTYNVNFYNSVIKAQGINSYSDALNFFGDTNTMTFTDCILYKIDPHASATLTDTVYSDPGVYAKGENKLFFDKYSNIESIGETLIGGDAAKSLNSVRRTFYLTNEKVYGFTPDLTDSELWDVPSTANLNGIAYAGDSTNKYVILYGDGFLYKDGSPWNDFQLVTDNAGINWQSHVTSENGTVWLLGDGGEITEYDSSTDTFTARTSGVTHPLENAVYDGTAMIVVGSEAGVTGSILRSTDGTTWTRVLFATNAYRLHAVVYANSVWIAAGDRGVTYTSTDGVTWSASSLGMSVDFKGGMSDKLRKRVVLWGEVAEHTDTAIFYDGSDSTTFGDWVQQAVDLPVDTVGTFVSNPYMILNSDFTNTIWYTSPVFSPYFSEVPSGWKSAPVPRNNTGTTETKFFEYDYLINIIQ